MNVYMDFGAFSGKFRGEIKGIVVSWGLIMFLVSCSKIIEVNLGPIESKLVLEGRLSPQRGLEVLIYHTRNPYDWVDLPLDSSIYFVEDAKIEIYDGEVLLDEGIYTGRSFYQSKNPSRIIAGKDYTVQVIAEGFPSVQVVGIYVPPEAPEVRNFKLTPFPNQKYLTSKSDTLSFEVRNRPKYTVYAVDVRYTNYPMKDYNGFINDFGESFDPCGGRYYFTNRCFSETWIKRKHEYRSDKNSTRQTFFLISIIEPKILDFIGDDSEAGEDGFTEPPLYVGNVEGGFGYIVGENQVRFPYK